MTKDKKRHNDLIEVVSYLVSKEKYRNEWAIKFMFSNEKEKSFLIQEWVGVKNSVMPTDMNNSEETPIIPIVEQIVKNTLLDIEEEE